MQRLSFEEASEIIQDVDAELQAILSVIWSQCTRDRAALCFHRAKYSFTRLIFKNGVALDPDQQPLAPSLLLPGGLPLGLITGNTVEVLNEVIRNRDIIEMPQSLLSKGQMVGVFECVDDHLGVKERPRPSWTISAGSRSFKFLEFPTREDRWKRLRTKVARLSPYNRSEALILTEIELLQTILGTGDALKNWNAEVLYFAPAWFDEANRQFSTKETSVPARVLYSYFKDLAWRSLARVRDRANELEDAINELGGDSNVPKCKAAYQLMRYTMDILAARRPCFAPLNGDSSLGPFHEIRDGILRVARLREEIMVPTYLKKGMSGFLSLSQLAPAAFEKNALDKLEDVFKIIARARNESIARDLLIPGLIDAPELLSAVCFRVKSGRRANSDQMGSVTSFRVQILPPNNRRHFEMEPTDLADFYEPHFADGLHPPPDSRFFKVAIKLDRRG
jgi:hypothetical protein